MNLTLIDWAIMGVAVVSLRMVSLSTKRYMKSVADFLAANRCAGRYLLTIAGQMGGIGVVSVIAMFEVMNSAGTAPNWWQQLMIPVAAIISLTGWVYYRFRETRALTLAQFFEMRYSKKFRIHAGILCWLSGVLNFGIFPGIAARFFIYYCGLPDYFHLAGVPFAINTFATVMAVDLLLALSFVLMGGQISVMITECIQGIFCMISFLVITICVLMHFNYPQLMHAVQLGSTPGASTINPFHAGQIKDFNIWFYLIGVFGAFYGHLSWQGSAGFNCSARSPHEQKMGAIIGIWRTLLQTLAISLLGLAAIAVIRLPEYAAQAAIINDCVSKIPNKTIQGQMMLPVALAHILPIGIKGLFGTIMLFISFTCHDTYMHSWGSIFIQDVYTPIKNKVLSPAERIKLLRWSILFVALFSYFFSLFYQPNQKILMFFATTATIWVGSGALIIGGLYWKRGTTAAAYATLYSGAILGLAGLWLPEIWKSHYHTEFPVNGQYLLFIAMVITLMIYISVSLITGKGRRQFNLEKMLHRGEYADDASHIVDEFHGNRWLKLVGINSEFSKGDKFLAILLVSWNALNLAWFLIFTAINLLFPITDRAWILYNWIVMIINLVVSVPCTIWFTVGGVLDIRGLFRSLETNVRDETDDGSVRSDERYATDLDTGNLAETNIK